MKELQVPLHWHSFTFSYTGYSSLGVTTETRTAYLGFPDNRITHARIQAAKEKVFMRTESVLLACAYLGFMTQEEFFSPEQEPEPLPAAADTYLTLRASDVAAYLSPGQRAQLEILIGAIRGGLHRDGKATPAGIFIDKSWPEYQAVDALMRNSLGSPENRVQQPCRG